MSFQNNAQSLRKQPRDYGFDEWRTGAYPHWAGTWEAEQFANINEGIAEILNAIATEARRAETPESGSVHEGAGRNGIAQEDAPSSDMGKGE